MTDLGTLGGTFSYAYAINDAGQVTGQSYLTGNGVSDAFLYSAGRMTDLGRLAGRYGSEGRGINASGEVTGDSNGRAFLYDAGTLYDLSTLVSSGLSSGVFLADANGINDNGWIVADGSNGQAYLLEPTAPEPTVPEPASIALLALGAGVAATLAGRRRKPTAS